MDRKKFDEMLKSKDALQIGGIGGSIFKDPNDRIAIMFYFMYLGENPQLLPPKKECF